MRRLKTYKGIVVVKQGAAESDPFAILVAAFKATLLCRPSTRLPPSGKIVHHILQAPQQGLW